MTNGKEHGTYNDEESNGKERGGKERGKYYNVASGRKEIAKNYMEAGPF